MNLKNSSVARGAKMWRRSLVKAATIAALAWIPVYFFQTVAALGLDVSGRVTGMVEAIRAGHSVEISSVSLLTAYAVMSIALMLFAVALSQGALVAGFAASERGATIDVGDAYRTAWRRLPAFLGAIGLVAVIVILGEAALFVIGATAIRLAGSSGPFALVLIAGTVLPLIMATPFLVSPQAAVLEGMGPLRALRRSRRLLRGNYPRAFGILVFLSLIGWIAGAALGLPLRSIGSVTLFAILNAVMAAVGAIVIGPFVVAVLTALFFDGGGSMELTSPSGQDDRDPTRKAIAIGLASLLLIAAGGNNTVVAINTKDDSTDVKVAFKIVRANGDIVAPANIAFAYASCTSCETAAIAIEVVFVTSTDASVVSPVNEAFAVNYACTDCQTLADAYQFTLTTGGPVHLTPEGNQEMAQIHHELEDIAHSDMSLSDTVTAVQGLANQVQQVLATQVVPAGSPDQNTQAPAASPAPSPSGNASPQASPSPSPSASPSSSPSPSPSPSPS
ncbi:MAG TPA: hypothetical protein VKE27_09910 [Candidatus Dormibacteraeota bacterium]|nr:hypothetical protein [Candidatus Dormibacteraeota bacterium]